MSDTAHGGSSGRGSAILVFLIFAVLEGVLLAWLAGHRGVDADEGFYMTAGAHVLAGDVPYVDFFYPQMPYLPYAEALAFAAGGLSLWSARLVSIVPAALLAGLLAAATQRRWGTSVAALIGLAFAANALALSILSTGKTYGATNLALVIAFLLCSRKDLRNRDVLLAGISAALAVGMRLPSVAVAGVLFLSCLRGGWACAAAFAGGFFIGSVPWLIIAAQDPHNFWFCNVEFHGQRQEIAGLQAILRQKATVLAKWLFTPQNAVIWLLAALGFWRRSRESVLALLCAVVLAAGYLAATPTYLQYLTQVVPFLLLAAAPGIAALLGRKPWLAVVAIVYLVGLAFALRPPAEDTQLWHKRQTWSLQTVDEITGYLRDHSAPDDRILSWWEGYPVLAGRPGFEGVGFWESNAAKKLPAAKRRRLHLRNQEDVGRLIADRVPKLIVVPDGTWEALRGLINLNYAEARRLEAVAIFHRHDDAPAAARDTAEAGEPR